MRQRRGASMMKPEEMKTEEPELEVETEDMFN